MYLEYFGTNKLRQSVKNMARIAKAALHKLPGKSSLNVRSVRPVCPVYPDVHDGHYDHNDHDD